MLFKKFKPKKSILAYILAGSLIHFISSTSAQASPSNYNEHPSKKIVRSKENANPVCIINYESQQYKVSSEELKSCFQSEINHGNDYDSITIVIHASKLGTPDSIQRITVKRSDEIKNIMRTLFPEIAHVEISVKIDNRTAYISLIPKKKTAVEPAPAVTSAQTSCPAIPEPVVCPAQAACPAPIECPAPPPVIREIKKTAFFLGVGNLFIKTNRTNIVDDKMDSYMASLITDILPETPSGSIYGGVQYMTASSNRGPAGYSNQYQRDDFSAFLGMTYILLHSQSENFSAFLELGPGYLRHSLTTSTTPEGNVYHSAPSIYSGVGFNYTNDSGVFIRVGEKTIFSRQDSFANDVVIKSLVFGTIFELGYIF